MPTFIALLRGINVGTAKRIAMADLRALLETNGFSDVVTLLNSGNVVFRASKGTPASLAGDIKKAIATKLNMDVPVIVKSEAEFAVIVEGNPLVKAAQDHSRLLVAFVQDRKALATLKAIQPLALPPDRYVVGDSAAYLACPDGILQSKAGKALLGSEGKFATTRNWSTVMKLRALIAKANS